MSSVGHFEGIFWSRSDPDNSQPHILTHLWCLICVTARIGEKTQPVSSLFTFGTVFIIPSVFIFEEIKANSLVFNIKQKKLFYWWTARSSVSVFSRPAWAAILTWAIKAETNRRGSRKPLTATAPPLIIDWPFGWAAKGKKLHYSSSGGNLYFPWHSSYIVCNL